MRVVVVGAGSSGLAAIKALREQGLNVEAYERGSDLGGLWRYENDNGLSAAYASLRTNVSRRRMQYPSFAMPRSYGDFPNHAEMATYLSAYADAFALRDSIHFQIDALAHRAHLDAFPSDRLAPRRTRCDASSTAVRTGMNDQGEIVCAQPHGRVGGRIG